MSNSGKINFAESSKPEIKEEKSQAVLKFLR